MVVVVLSDCPAKLRGDLSKWLFEINTGVYVGNLSARVRELLWDRICDNVKHGQATMVYSAKGEQKMEFCVHNTSWKIVDFDGLKLMQRPLPKEKENDEKNFDQSNSEQISNASKFEKARRIQISEQKAMQERKNYVIIDIETTGLSHLSDDIIEIGAVRITDGRPVKQYQALIKIDKKIPQAVVDLTGITNEKLLCEGKELYTVLQELIAFVEKSVLVCHNASFDINFIKYACKKEGLEAPKNKCIDTIILAKKKLKGLKNYKLSTIAEHLSISTAGMHRALRDCYITYGIFTKLNEI